MQIIMARHYHAKTLPRDFWSKIQRGEFHDGTFLVGPSDNTGSQASVLAQNLENVHPEREDITTRSQIENAGSAFGSLDGTNEMPRPARPRAFGFNHNARPLSGSSAGANPTPRTPPLRPLSGLHFTPLPGDSSLVNTMSDTPFVTNSIGVNFGPQDWSHVPTYHAQNTASSLADSDDLADRPTGSIAHTSQITGSTTPIDPSDVLSELHLDNSLKEAISLERTRIFDPVKNAVEGMKASIWTTAMDEHLLQCWNRVLNEPRPVTESPARGEAHRLRALLMIDAVKLARKTWKNPTPFPSRPTTSNRLRYHISHNHNVATKHLPYARFRPNAPRSHAHLTRDPTPAPGMLAAAVTRKTRTAQNSRRLRDIYDENVDLPFHTSNDLCNETLAGLKVAGEEWFNSTPYYNAHPAFDTAPHIAADAARQALPIRPAHPAQPAPAVVPALPPGPAPPAFPAPTVMPSLPPVPAFPFFPAFAPLNPSSQYQQLHPHPQRLSLPFVTNGTASLKRRQAALDRELEGPRRASVLWATDGVSRARGRNTISGGPMIPGAYGAKRIRGSLDGLFPERGESSAMAQGDREKLGSPFRETE